MSPQNHADLFGHGSYVTCMTSTPCELVLSQGTLPIVHYVLSMFVVVACHHRRKDRVGRTIHTEFNYACFQDSEC